MPSSMGVRDTIQPTQCANATSHSLCNMTAIQLTEDRDFLLDIINLVLGIFQIDDLDRDRRPCSFVKALVHLSVEMKVAEGTRSNMRQESRKGMSVRHYVGAGFPQAPQGTAKHASKFGGAATSPAGIAHITRDMPSHTSGTMPFCNTRDPYPPCQHEGRRSYAQRMHAHTCTL